jgi:epidermal growth factor receptor substrate 15
MSGQISTIPSTLPPGLYQKAAGMLTPDIDAIAPSTSVEMVDSNYRTQHPTRMNCTEKSSLHARSTSYLDGIPLQWDISPSEKASADRFFDALDRQNKGFIQGDTAVPFMLESKLGEETLAQIW